MKRKHKKLSKTALRAMRLKNLAKARKARKLANPKHRKRKAARKVARRANPKKRHVAKARHTARRRNPFYQFDRTSKKGKTLRRHGHFFLVPKDEAKIRSGLARAEARLDALKKLGKSTGIKETAMIRKYKSFAKQLKSGLALALRRKAVAEKQKTKMTARGWAASEKAGIPERKYFMARKRKATKKRKHVGKKRHVAKRKTAKRKTRRTRKVAMASIKAKFPRKLKRHKRFTSVVKRGKKRFSVSVYRKNPSFLPAKIEGVFKMITAHDSGDAAALLAGGMIYGGFNGFVLKNPALASYVGMINTSLNKIPVVGVTLTQIIGPVMPNLLLGSLLNVAGAKLKQPMLCTIGKGLFGACVAAVGANAANVVAAKLVGTSTLKGIPSLRGRRMGVTPTLRGVDYTPGMRGVDYTPGMHGVDYTPGMGKSADFGQYHSSKADFGRSPDFGGVPSLRGAHDHDGDADYDAETGDEDNETSGHLG